MNTFRGMPVSIRATLLGLLALVLALPWWLYDNTSWSLSGALLGGAAVPALLIWAVRRRARNWSGITALCMIPITVIGVMDLIANLEQPLQGLLIALFSIVVFFAVLDAGRRLDN